MTMKTLFDIVNAPKTAKISLEKCFIVKTQDNGTFNISCEINGKREYVNYVDVKLCKDNSLYVKYGKKEEDWKKDRWYQIEPPVEAETKEEK